MFRRRTTVIGGWCAAAVWAALAGAGAAAQAVVTADGLEDQKPHGPYAARSGEFRLLSVNVPAGLDLMVVEASDGQGNADLFLRYGAAPCVATPVSSAL